MEVLGSTALIHTQAMMPSDFPAVEKIMEKSLDSFNNEYMQIFLTTCIADVKFTDSVFSGAFNGIQNMPIDMDYVSALKRWSDVICDEIDRRSSEKLFRLEGAKLTRKELGLLTVNTLASILKNLDAPRTAISGLSVCMWYLDQLMPEKDEGFNLHEEPIMQMFQMTMNPGKKLEMGFFTRLQFLRWERKISRASTRLTNLYMESTRKKEEAERTNEKER